ncbi:MAG: RnfABCDGE type electron transport complex subunit D [Planctomycetota bacterium]|nr:RnfABCDGE type electron transport complex subunit D [Planctomycetota bacterium]
MVGHWPHMRGPETTARIMWSVAAALGPAAVFAGYVFGWRAYLHMALAVVTAVAVEALITRLRLKRVTVGDGSAVVTGLLVAFCLPAHARWFVPVVASAVAIGIAKQAFGGLGCNIWNPALVGRAFVHVSFPTDMNPSAWPVLTGDHFTGDVGTAVGGLPEGVDAVTGASPLAHLKALLDANTEGPPGELPDLWDMAVGTVGGSIGETSALLLVLGAIYLIYKGWVRWRVPLAYLGTVAAGALLLPLDCGEKGWLPIVFQAGAATLAPRLVAYHLLGGGLMLGALYMATDMVTSPLTNKGLWIFGAGCGVLTILIRRYGGYPEGVCYAILLMNTTVPLIDRWTQPRIFGHKR